jgi:hypothetical protein
MLHQERNYSTRRSHSMYCLPQGANDTAAAATPRRRALVKAVTAGIKGTAWVTQQRARALAPCHGCPTRGQQAAVADKSEAPLHRRLQYDRLCFGQREAAPPERSTQQHQAPTQQPAVHGHMHGLGGAATGMPAAHPLPPSAATATASICASATARTSTSVQQRQAPYATALEVGAAHGLGDVATGVPAVLPGATPATARAWASAEPGPSEMATACACATLLKPKASATAWATAVDVCARRRPCRVEARELGGFAQTDCCAWRKIPRRDGLTPGAYQLCASS